MSRYPLYILDLDGTLFRGDEPIPGARETVALLRSEGAAIRYLTNNSTRSRESYVEKLARMGFEVHPGEVYTSALVAAEYLRGKIKSAYVVGEEGLIRALEDAGIRVGEVDPEVVVVGLCRFFNYEIM